MRARRIGCTGAVWYIHRDTGPEACFFPRDLRERDLRQPAAIGLIGVKRRHRSALQKDVLRGLLTQVRRQLPVWGLLA